jgi:hypothetical protein
MAMLNAPMDAHPKHIAFGPAARIVMITCIRKRGGDTFSQTVS